MTIFKDLLTNVQLWLQSIFAGVTENDVLTWVAIGIFSAGGILIFLGLRGFGSFFAPGPLSNYPHAEARTRARLKGAWVGVLLLAFGGLAIWVADGIWLQVKGTPQISTQR